MSATAWVVYCETHRNFLARASVGGTTWTDARAAAKRYDTKPAAQAAAKLATWLDHRPIVWAVDKGVWA